MPVNWSAGTLHAMNTRSVIMSTEHPLDRTLTPEQESQKARHNRRRTGRKLFIARMKREGRWREWTSKVRTYQENGAKHYSVAALKAMKEMGFEGIDGEEELEKKRLYGLDASERAIAHHARRRLEKDERDAKGFEGVVSALPTRAPYQDEIDWIRAHPAMMRLGRSQDKTQAVRIGINDILNTPAGRAPSQSAVYMLEHWANNPSKFYEKTLDEHKKIKDADGTKGKPVVDAGIGEIEALLGEVAKELQ
jgi:hypothetical protein